MDDSNTVTVVETKQTEKNMTNTLPYSSRLSRIAAASAKLEKNVTNTLANGYNILPPTAIPPVPAKPFQTLACQISVGDYSAKPTNEINPSVDKVITFLFYTLPLFCFQAVARPLMFLAAIALIIWGFCHGPLWCLVAVFVHFPIAFMLLRGTFCSWKSKETATIPEISL